MKSSLTLGLFSSSPALARNENLGGTIHSEFGDMPLLEVFQVANTKVSGNIPTEFGQIKTLVTFDVTFCGDMSGQIPSEFGNLENLQELWLRKSLPFFLHDCSLPSRFRHMSFSLYA